MFELIGAGAVWGLLTDCCRDVAFWVVLTVLSMERPWQNTVNASPSLVTAEPTP